MTKLLTTRDLAERFQVTLQTIYNLRAQPDKSKLPPAVKIGRELRWREEDVDAWLAAQLAAQLDSPAAESNVTSIGSRRAS